jgi:hypothetical protein
MLEAELQGEPYRKSEHRRALMPQLSGVAVTELQIEQFEIIL